MENFNKTFTLLDQLINRLEANTGGQLNQEPKVADKQEKKSKKQKKSDPKEQEKAQKQVEKEIGKKVQQKQKKNTKKQKKQKKEGQEGEKQKKQEKKPKKEEPKKEPGQFGVQDFALVDIRIGELVDVWKHPESEKLYCQKINICGEVREIASGLQQYIPIQDMKGKVIVMVNLKPRPLGGFPSNGMVVSASTAEHTDFELVHPEGEISERVYLQGYQQVFKGGPVLPQLNPKKKILEKALQHFRTDEQGFVTWKGIKARTSGGYLRSKFVKGIVS